jgi:hypothetical protein
MPSVKFINFYAKCRYAECRYNECHGAIPQVGTPNLETYIA